MKNTIKMLRAKHNLTQEDLAQKVNVTRQTILAIERSKYPPSLPLALAIAKVFNTPVEEIFQ